MPNDKKRKREENAAKKSVSVADVDLTLVFGIASSNRARVKAAIDAGADVNYSHKGRSCLLIAAEAGHHEIVDLLLSAGAEKDAKSRNGFTALMAAAQNGHDKCIELLLTAGADKESKTGKGFTALIIASQNGHDKCVDLLLTARADKNANTQAVHTALIDHRCTERSLQVRRAVVHGWC
jgi:serine/threonine-protein phosphatase 6 regulatory ankyrin repeat subunit B